MFAATLMLHPHNILNELIMGLQREKIMRSEGVFIGSIMGDEGSEQSGAWHKKTLQEIMGSHNARNKKIMGS
jgi:hypothetical protein